MKKEEIVGMTMPKRFRIWDNLHKRWFRGSHRGEARELGVDAFDVFGETMLFGAALSDQNEDDAWKDVSFADKMNNLICIQSTGLRDNDGKEIFEGDIIKFRSLVPVPELGRKYDARGIGYTRYELGALFVDSGLDEEMFSLDEIAGYAQYIKIIGNIFENPELVEL